MFVYKVFEVFVYKVFIDVKYLYKKYLYIIRLIGGKIIRVGISFRKKMGVFKLIKLIILVRNRCICEIKFCGLYKKIGLLLVFIISILYFNFYIFYLFVRFI